MKYYQLNCKTGYDFYQSTILPDEYALRAKELGYSGIGFADPSFYCYPSFTKAALNNQLKPIYGYRLALASSETHPLDAVLYILNEKGYENLCLLLAMKKEIYALDDLSRYHDGLALILDTECGDYVEPLFQQLVSPLLVRYRQIFLENFYLGVSIASQNDKENLPDFYRFTDTFEYQTIAFPKTLYLRKSDAYKFELFKAAGKKQVVHDLANEGPYFLLSGKSLSSLYREKDLQNVEDLVDRMDFQFFTKRGKLISFDHADERLKEQATSGLIRLFPQPIEDVYINRLNYELDVIKDMHFSSYFLLVADYVSYSKHCGIKVGPGRGSAGGSLVSYALGITELDPIKYDLSFERFLNPKRATMPDIDIDFEDDRRGEVVDYLKKRYGEDRVSEIMTFSTLKPRSALNLIGPALGISPSRLKELTNAIPAMANTFEEAKADSYYGYRMNRLLQDPYYNGIIEKASSLLGLPINTSRHAAGVILSEDPIYKYTPMSNGTTGVCVYEYEYMEKLGYLKVDILALSNLTFIHQIEEEIKRDMLPIPDIQSHLDDKKTFDILNSLSLSYIFQLESRGMRETISQVKPTCFSDIASLIALYRPGPKDYIPLFADRKNGKRKTTYLTPLLEPILKDTYGIMVYQEEVMQVVQKVANFSASDADLFRRAISKKNIKLMESYKEDFLKGCLANSIDETTALKLYDDIEKFSNYGFNKSHAYCYAMIVYTLLYYKANYPKQFYNCAMKLTSLNSSAFVQLGSELKKRNQQILAPHINFSLQEDLLFDKNMVYLPLDNIGGLDVDFLSQLLTERKNSGIYTSFYSLLLRNRKALTEKARKSLVSLIEAGTFDVFSPRRNALKAALPNYFEFAKLNFATEAIPPLGKEEEDLGERLNQEKLALGIILSTRLNQIASKKEYKTLLVCDDSFYERGHRIKATSENTLYEISLEDFDVHPEKNSFLLVKSNFNKKGTVYPDDVIVLGKRKVN